MMTISKAEIKAIAANFRKQLDGEKSGFFQPIAEMAGYNCVGLFDRTVSSASQLDNSERGGGCFIENTVNGYDTKLVDLWFCDDEMKGVKVSNFDEVFSFIKNI